VGWSPEAIPLSFKAQIAAKGASVRRPGFLSLCKVVINWCVLGIVFVRTLDALERDFAARARHKKRDYRADEK
jgi:hypothetical protein